MKNATTVILISTLVLTSIALASHNDVPPNGRRTGGQASHNDVGQAGKKDLWSKNDGLHSRLAPSTHAATTVSSEAFDRLPETFKTFGKSSTTEIIRIAEGSVYDFGWNNFRRDFVNVSAAGNVHIFAFLRSNWDSNDRHVVYWYAPGKAEGFLIDVTTRTGEGWADSDLFSDGRTVVAWHTANSATEGIIVDALEGFGLFADTGAPVEGIVFPTIEVDDVNDELYWSYSEDGDSIEVYSTADFAVTFDQITAIYEGNHTGGKAEQQLRTSMDGTEVAIASNYGGRYACRY